MEMYMLSKLVLRFGYDDSPNEIYTEVKRISDALQQSKEKYYNGQVVAESVNRISKRLSTVLPTYGVFENSVTDKYVYFTLISCTREDIIFTNQRSNALYVAKNKVPYEYCKYIQYLSVAYSLDNFRSTREPDIMGIDFISSNLGEFVRV